MPDGGATDSRAGRAQRGTHTAGGAIVEGGALVCHIIHYCQEKVVKVSGKVVKVELFVLDMYGD